MYTEEYTAFSRNMKLQPIQGKWYHPMIHKVAEMLNRGDSPTIAFVGDTNNGKSMKALRLSEILYDELNLFKGSWTADENLVYDVKPFLETMVNIPTPDEGETINEQRKAIIFDEGGVNLNSKDYHSDTNRGVDEVLQTMRIKNCLYMFVTPNLRDLDKSIRKNIDFVVSVKDQGFAVVNGIKQVRDRFDTKYERGFVQYPYWTPDLPRDELIRDYRRKEYPHKQGFVEERLEKIKDKEVEAEFEDW